LEVLTTSPTNRSKDMWLQRTVASSGRQLGGLRDRLFEMAGIQRHHLVLDANAGSGLLTWEAVRRAPEGGVWALAADEESGEALRQQAARLPEVERPAVLVGDPAELGYLLTLRGEADVRFDIIMGRNILSRPDRSAGGSPRETCQILAAHLLPGGRLVFAQPIPRHTQRLYKLIEWGRDAKLRDKVIAAEEAIYNDPADPMVNWDESDLRATLEATGFTDVLVTVEEQVEERLITAVHLDRWFSGKLLSPREGLGEGRPSYRERLLAGELTETEVSKVEKLFRNQLLDQAVSWSSQLAFIRAAQSQE
jgi:putative ATPase